MDIREGNPTESLNPPPVHPGTNNNGKSPGTPSDADVEVEEESRFFSSGNLIMLAMMFIIFVLILYKFTFEEMGAIVKAALGLSFVIFIHELGHFLAAKWCDVNVTTFSIGFGPAIPGCRYKWGETTYKLAILPLGGYVQMVGQVDGDEASDGSEDDPRSYRRKSVPQRMLIISAGVIMNAILAVVCFIFVYEGPGKEHTTAIVNYADSGGPLFTKGIHTGSLITEIDHEQDPTFTTLTQIVINTTESQELPMVFQRPDEAPVSALIKPRKEPTDLKPYLGVLPAYVPKLVPKGGGRESPCFADTPAFDANLQFSDEIVAMTDPDDPLQAKDYRSDRLKELKSDPQNSKFDERYFDFERRLQLLADKEITLRVRRKVDKDFQEVNVKVAPMFRIDLGARMQMGPITAMREKSFAAQDKRVRVPEGNRRGDIILAVSVKDVDDKPLEFKDKENTLDPERLPFQLRQWSDRLDRAKDKRPRTVTLTLSRQREAAGPDAEEVKVELPWDSNWRFDRIAPFARNSPMAIPELGIGYQIKARVVHVTGKDTPLKENDVIKNIRFDVVRDKAEGSWLREQIFDRFGAGKPTGDDEIPWMRKDIEEGQWAYISVNRFLLQPFKFTKVVVRIEREKKIQEVEIPISEDKSWPLDERGWNLMNDSRRVKASSPLEAVAMGFRDTSSRMLEVFQNLRGMIFGRISTENLGGPLSIAALTYRFAGMDFGDFVWFLGLISINLAVVNFLPIPVLDGGHMVFLIYEKLRGQPASEGIRIAATYVGLAVVGCLMIFVLYLDVTRLFF